MSMVEYMAKRSLVVGHLSEVRYLADFDIEEATFEVQDVRDIERSDGGGSEVSFERQDVFWTLVFAPVNGPRLAALREFLDSTESGEAFTVNLWNEDAEPLTLKRLEASHTEDSFVRVGSLDGDYYRATVVAVVSTADGEAIDIYSEQVGGTGAAGGGGGSGSSGGGGFNAPLRLSGIINITTGDDPLPPFYTGKGLYYYTVEIPLGAPVSGTLNSNSTGYTIAQLDVQFSGGVPVQVNISFTHTAHFEQDAFTSIDVGGLETVDSIDATYFSQDAVSGGYFVTQWQIPLTIGAFAHGTYNFTFS